MALLCNCLYRGSCQSIKKGCAYVWLFLLYLFICIIYTPTVIVGALGVMFFFPCHKICPDTWIDNCLYHTCWVWMITYVYYWKWVFSREMDVKADDDVY